MPEAMAAVSSGSHLRTSEASRRPVPRVPPVSVVLTPAAGRWPEERASGPAPEDGVHIQCWGSWILTGTGESPQPPGTEKTQRHLQLFPPGRFPAPVRNSLVRLIIRKGVL